MLQQSLYVCAQRPTELVAMYYAMELLRIVAELHAAHVIHTDIKPDNLLLREPISAAFSEWQPCRPGQWQSSGLCLIDYGRAVDTALLPEGTQFQVNLTDWNEKCLLFCTSRMIDRPRTHKE